MTWRQAWLPFITYFGTWGVIVLSKAALCIGAMWLLLRWVGGCP